MNTHPDNDSNGSTHPGREFGTGSSGSITPDGDNPRPPATP